jgi:hypothetical protein
MQLLLALLAPVLSQVTDLADVSARVASLEQQLRSANAAIAASWSTLAAEACVLTDEYSSERMSKLQSLDAVGRLASNVEGQARAQQAHLLAKVDEGEESYNKAASMQASESKELTTELDSTDAMITALDEVLDMIKLRLGNDTGSAGEVVGVFKGMQISSADEKAKIEAAIEEKTSMYTGIMSTAGKEIRALQEVYVEEHRKAVHAAEQLASVEAQRALLNKIASDEAGLLELRRTACGAVQAGATAFARRVTNLESQAAQTQGVLEASLATVRASRPHTPARTEVAAEAVDALASKGESQALHRLAKELRLHSVADDIRMLGQLQHEMATSANVTDCKTARLAATADQAAARDVVIGLEERNASLTAAVALAEAQMEVLSPAIERAENVSEATTKGFGNFSGAWEAGVAAATSAETELASLKAAAEEYAASDNATVEGASLPSMIEILQSNVAALKSESEATEMTLIDATATLALRQQAVAESRAGAAGAISSAREANATALSEVQGELTEAWENLEAARAATDEANNCSVSFGALERNVLKVAVAALRPVTGATVRKDRATKRAARRLRGP